MTAVPSQAFPNFTVFAETWLLPQVSVRLAEGQRENTFTWCSRWWAHRPVAVRIAHLHNAFESSRGPGAANFLTGHLDPHLRVILDAARGPVHRCTPKHHVPTPTLPFEPFPAEKITRTPGSGGGNTTTEKSPPPRFDHYSSWVQQWLLPVTAVRVSAANRENTYTWCARWFDHHGVAVRFALLHRAFEAAVVAKDRSAMSSLFTRQIDPSLRWILDAANGPLHRCTPTAHQPLPAVPTAPVPAHWFGVDPTTVAVERLGFGPDYRGLADLAAGDGAS